MDRRYSPIVDMYGTAPQDEPPRHKGHSWLYVLLTIAGFFVFESIQPVMRLRPDPPLSVLGASLNHDEAANVSQARMAQACWDYAITSVQRTYPYGRDLPRNPPQNLNRVPGTYSAISVECWPRLRVAWMEPESWVRKYEWSTDWVTDPGGPFQRTLRTFLNRLGIRF